MFAIGNPLDLRSSVTHGVPVAAGQGHDELSLSAGAEPPLALDLHDLRRDGLYDPLELLLQTRDRRLRRAGKGGTRAAPPFHSGTVSNRDRHQPGQEECDQDHGAP